MGVGLTVGSLDNEEILEMQKGTHFTKKEIKRLYERFRNIDRDSSGFVHRSELLKIPELAVNPIANRVVDMFDIDKKDNINFKNFIDTLSPFSPHSSKKEKIDFAFKIYDIDKDGFIGFNDLTAILKMMTGDNLSEKQLDELVKNTILEADQDGDQKLSKKEFADSLCDEDLNKMKIRVL